ncbi:MAG: aspartate carbamoyltransferase catalytic subunit [Terriglobia bacterium]|jgi:aspartate carbamoyltransferase catalytic subunit|nr:aspartate carbamoyltransferase catalytic subunit [Terriglobia bacterium]
MKKNGRGSLLAIEPLTPEQINVYLRTARKMHPGRNRPLLKGKRVVLLFYESSTRTRTSFQLAAKELGALTTVITASASSIEKGESLIDTGLTVQALGADAIVIRHPSSGAPYVLARHLHVPIINAGDGMHAHPSQALLDAVTMLDHFKTLKGLRVLITGDIFHSRVARSNIQLLTKFGARVTLCGPKILLPDVAAEIAPGLRIVRDFNEALQGTEVIMMLRVQKERLQGLDIDAREYVANYQLTMDRVKMAAKNAIVMHPGPIIRGMEITDEAADCPQSVILEQVHNGLRTRMGILAHHVGGRR